MECEGRVGEYVGGYTDWLRQRSADEARAATSARETPKPAAATPAAVPAKRKLSFKETRELESLPGLIETLERDVATLTDALSEPRFYTRDAADITAHNAKLADAQARLDAAYARWAELDG
jgi:ATP-binding cassette subfamily F protein uup